MSDDIIDIESEDYVCSLRTNQVDILPCKVRFSNGSSFVATITNTSLKIYDLRKNPVQQDDGAKAIECESELEFNLNRPAYDRILGAFIDEDEVKNSWVVLSSKEFNYMDRLRNGS